MKETLSKLQDKLTYIKYNDGNFYDLCDILDDLIFEIDDHVTEKDAHENSRT